MTATRTTRLQLVFVAALASCVSEESVRQALERTGQRAVDDAADTSYDAARERAVRAAHGGADRAEPTAKEAPAEGAAPSGKAEATVPPRNAPTAPAADDGERPAKAQGVDAYGNRYDFVPGEKLILFDDFTDGDVGEYPARWKQESGTPAEIVSVKGRRFLKVRAVADGEQGRHWVRLDAKEDLPRTFTLELEADMDGPFTIHFAPEPGGTGTELQFASPDVLAPNAKGVLGTARSGVQRVAIAVSGTQAKVYVGGERVLIDPDAIQRPLTGLGINFPGAGAGACEHQMITSVRLAEGGKDARTLLTATGRFVTHGITFDTGSDAIRPESGPTLREILAVLKDSPGLRLSVEGHTDAQGGAAVNRPLSEKRAAAVKKWLVGQGVGASRLETRGLGDTKPIDSNSTPQGRANNRRVEFVKQ